MRIFGTTALVLATLTLAACGGSSDDSGSSDAPATPDSASTPTKPDNAGSAAEGQEIFASNCASCHTLADAGAAGQVGPNLDQAMPSAATVNAMVTNGGNGMPSFSASLDPAEIDAVSKYVSSVAGS